MSDWTELQMYLVEQWFVFKSAEAAEEIGLGWRAELKRNFEDEATEEEKERVECPTNEDIARLRAGLKGLLRQIDEYDVKRKWR